MTKVAKATEVTEVINIADTFVIMEEMQKRLRVGLFFGGIAFIILGILELLGYFSD